MIAAWMIFGVVITVLVALAAVLAERAGREVGSASLRWIWAGAMAAPAVLLTLALGSSHLRGKAAPVEMEGMALLPEAALLAGPESSPVLLTVAEGGWLDRIDGMVLGVWAVLSVALALRFVVGVIQLRRQMRGWPEVDLPQGPVLVSGDTGPALLGLFRRQVVLPRWCLALDDAHRELILAHEAEHARSRDTLLLTAGWGLLLLFPWNLPLWGMYARLREAVELDCDARVTRRYPGKRRRYGELLLMVGGHRSGSSPLPLATFSDRPSTLERRIDMLTRSGFPVSRPRALLLAGGGILLVAGACLIPGPDRMDSVTGPEEEEEVGQPSGSVESSLEVAREPTFTPFTQAPEVRNRAEIGAALEAAYPTLLRDAGVGGTTLLHFFIDTDGAVGSVLVAESSGHPALDDAAVRVGSVFDFSPAMNRDEAVPVWIQIPVAFQPRGGAEGAGTAPGPEVREELARQVLEAADAQRRSLPQLQGESDLAGELADGPTFTPFTQAPELRNRGAVGEALVEEYPALLRDAGVGGRVLVHVLIDEDGVVRRVEVAEGSGHPALDAAALRVAQVMAFSGARNRDEAVPVWVQLPITFQPR
ncbi:MAG: TonB family protein [Gemmatimonadales bacterium]|nr:MAG: TonB family protein [Gemmatimonadales bacterium]